MSSPGQTQTIQMPAVAGRNPTATLLASADLGVCLVYNNGPNTVWIGNNNAIIAGESSVIPLSVNSSIVGTGDHDIYGVVAAGLPSTIFVLDGAQSFFAPTSLSGLGGIAIYNTPIAPTQPPTIPLNSLWFTPTGGIEQWNGSAWVVQEFDGQQIIVANSITVNELAAGIVYAGIVNGTLIQGATIRVINSFGATIMTINKSTATWLLYADTGSSTQGALIASGAATTGTDEFGNAYLAQITGYGFNSGVGIYVATQIGGAAGFGAGVNMFTAPAANGPWSLQATFSTDTSGTWSFNANNYKFLSSGSPSQHIVAADALIQQRQVSTWQGYATTSLTDNSTATIAAAAFQNLTKIWSIPAHDASIATVYRLTCGGFIGVGASLSVLSLQLILGTVSINFPIGSAEFIANNTYGWRMQGEFMVFSGPLNSAQIVGSAEFSIGTGVANMATVAGSTQTAGGFAQQTVVGSIDMTTAKSMAFQAKWGSVITNQQIVCNYSILERIGP